MEAFPPIKIRLWFYDSRWWLLAGQWLAWTREVQDRCISHLFLQISKMHSCMRVMLSLCLPWSWNILFPVDWMAMSVSFDQTQLDSECLSVHLKKAILCPLFVFYPQKTQFLRDVTKLHKRKWSRWWTALTVVPFFFLSLGGLSFRWIRVWSHHV